MPKSKDTFLSCGAIAPPDIIGIVCLSLTILILSSAPYPAAASSPSTSLLVQLREDVSPEHAGNLFDSLELHVERQIPHLGVWQVHGQPMARTEALLSALDQNPDVLWVEQNGMVHTADIVPNDNFYQARQWNLRKIGLPHAWLFTSGNANPIAIIDTGIDLDHPDLVAKLWINAQEIAGNGADDDGNGYIDDVSGWDFVHDNNQPDDDEGHGSHMASIAAASTNNKIGIAGISWHAALMPLKALSGQGTGYWADVAEAIVYAADNGAHIVNLSFGSNQSSQTIEAAVQYAQSRNCLLVAAAGNNDIQPTPVEYPAALPGVMAVAAATADDTIATFSNRGQVDVAAPGVDVLGGSKNGSYFLGSGTSVAAAHISGVAALIWAARPELSASQVAQVITQTAHDIFPLGWDTSSGWGRVDAYLAVLDAVCPQVQLAAASTSIMVSGEQVALTATVTFSGTVTLPAPDGVPVALFAKGGQVTPTELATHGGIATATFASGALPGQAVISASVGHYLGTVSIKLWAYQLYLPFVFKP